MSAPTSHAEASRSTRSSLLSIIGRVYAACAVLFCIGALICYAAGVSFAPTAPVDPAAYGLPRLHFTELTPWKGHALLAKHAYATIDEPGRLLEAAGWLPRRGIINGRRTYDRSGMSLRLAPGLLFVYPTFWEDRMPSMQRQMLPASHSILERR